MNKSIDQFNWWQVQPVFLYTDILVFILIAAFSVFFFYARKHEHLRAPWRQILGRRIAMASAVILLSFVFIGLSDSVHFKKAVSTKDDGSIVYSGETVSLFDQFVLPLKIREEKTYSAPFATQLYAKESIEAADGSITRGYPPLRYAGTHLTASDSVASDVLKRSAQALWKAVLVMMLLIVLIAWRLSMLNKSSFACNVVGMMKGQHTIPWRSILGAVGVLVLLLALGIELTPYYHVLGTDKVGQDVLYLALKSIRTGLMIGTLTTLVMLPFAILMGTMAGYFRGWIDDVIQYIYTTLSSIPGVLLIAAAVLMVDVLISNNPDLFPTITERADIKLLALCVILGITSWTSLCRLLRGETLKLREVDYIQAAHAFGTGHMRVISRHILPNVMHIILIVIVLDFSGLVLAEAVLAYVGVGVDPSMNSWGNMINGARLEMAREPVVWWSLLAAFIFMFTLVLAANLFADAVRDAFDPRLRSN